MYLLLFGKYLDTTNITLDRLGHRFVGTNEGVVNSLHQLYIRPQLGTYTLDHQHNPKQTSFVIYKPHPRTTSKTPRISSMRLLNMLNSLKH
jgi:hypothetical protein